MEESWFVIAVDIKKMYQQIELHENDRKYQRILWRFLKKGKKGTNRPIQIENRNLRHGQLITPEDGQIHLQLVLALTEKLKTLGLQWRIGQGTWRQLTVSFYQKQQNYTIHWVGYILQQHNRVGR